jgi:AraC-like DNA-binding protein
MTIYIADIIPIIIIFQSVLFALVLLTDKGSKKVSNSYLASFLIILALQFTVMLNETYGSTNIFLSTTFCVYGFAYGPLLYLYSRSLMYRKFHFTFLQLTHFIPFAILLLIAALGYSFCGRFGFLLYVSLLTYSTLAILKVITYRKILKETQSSLSRTDLVWLQWTIIIFCIALLLDMVDQLFWSTDLIAGVSSIHIMILLLINWMFYKGLKQPQIFLGITALDEAVFKEKSKAPSKTTPDTSEKRDLEHIQSFMRESDLYTNPDLSLKQLSEQLQIPPRRLSYLINAFLGRNFMGFINDHRIEKAKSRLQHPKDEGETILEVMYDVGFNSKSSFNTLFKQKTGLTPSEYKKKHLSS